MRWDSFSPGSHIASLLRIRHHWCAKCRELCERPEPAGLAAASPRRSAPGLRYLPLGDRVFLKRSRVFAASSGRKAPGGRQAKTPARSKHYLSVFAESARLGFESLSVVPTDFPLIGRDSAPPPFIRRVPPRPWVPRCRFAPSLRSGATLPASSSARIPFESSQ